jgi:tRNA dimethylallyltransferase
MRRALAIVGTTAAGKAELAREVARRFDRALLVCDSVKVYRGLDIGSSKPTAEHRALVPHHLLDLVAPDESFTAHDWAAHAWSLLARTRGIFVGGTGFYLRAAAWTQDAAADDGGRDEDPEHTAAARADFEQRWLAREAQTPGAIAAELLRVDPTTAAQIHVANRVRTLRALWLCHAWGRPVSLVRAEDPPRPRLDLMLVVVDPPPAVLDARIERRVDEMLARGFVREVEGLLAAGYHSGHKAMQTLGYRQLVDVVHGRTALAAARAEIIAKTRQYARRQRTYFRHQFPGAAVYTIATAAAAPWAALEAFAADDGVHP